MVVGYRMGLLARSTLNGKLKAVVHTGIRPPLSCIVDGVQFTSGCTLGKGNIEVIDEDLAKVVFLGGGKRLEITLRDEVRQDIDSRMSKETEVQMALSIFRAEPSSLFHIRTDH